MAKRRSQRLPVRLTVLLAGGQLAAAQHAPATPRKEPPFLCEGLRNTLRALVTDFVNFMLILVFYALCLPLGTAANILDRMFHTRMLDHLTRLIELLDTHHNSSTGKG